jgi:hypothetical protein
MRFDGTLKLIGMVTVTLLLAACSSTPKWVEKGPGSMMKDGKAFYGVGGASGIKNEPLARETADNRARADLAKYMDTYTAYLMRDYAASTTAGDFTKSSEEQNVERAVKTFVSTNLSGVVVVDRWEKDETNGKTIYSLVKMDLATFKDQIGQMKELSAQARDFVRKNAEQAFERLQQEEEKRGNK